MSSSYSCWPVLLAIYNLPSWLCFKRKFNMLTLLIAGPKKPGNDIDVYLAPLIDDLKHLWEVGVPTYDAFRDERFLLKGVLLWTINDFPAYGNLSGCQVKGYHACPICGEDTCVKRLKHSRKMLYTGHKRFLFKRMKLLNKVGKFRFVDPYNIGHIPSTNNDKKSRDERLKRRTRDLEERLVGTLPKQIVLVPVNVGVFVMLHGASSQHGLEDVQCREIKERKKDAQMACNQSPETTGWIPMRILRHEILERNN